MRLLAWFALSVAACRAADAGSPCRHDRECSVNSCTLGTCDAFPSCWSDCYKALELNEWSSDVADAGHDGRLENR